MIMVYQIEVDDETGPMVMGEMLKRYKITPTYVSDTKISRESIHVCTMENEKSKAVQISKFPHLKIVRTAI